MWMLFKKKSVSVVYRLKSKSERKEEARAVIFKRNNIKCKYC